MGGEGHLCRGFGVITHDSAGGEKLRGIVKGMEAHMASFGGGGLAECVHRVGKNEKDNQKECVGEMKKKRWKTKIIHDVN